MYKFNLKIIVLLLSLVVLNTLLIQKIKARNFFYKTGEYIIRPGSFAITFHGDVTQEKVDYLENKYAQYELKKYLNLYYRVIFYIQVRKKKKKLNL
jgi:hypothetical protein